MIDEKFKQKKLNFFPRDVGIVAKTQSRVRERTEKMNTHVENDEKRLVE